MRPERPRSLRKSGCPGAKFQITTPDAAFVRRATSSDCANGTSICNTETVSELKSGAGKSAALAAALRRSI
jgi:hypothetical protein